MHKAYLIPITFFLVLLIDIEFTIYRDIVNISNNLELFILVMLGAVVLGIIISAISLGGVTKWEN